MKSPQRFLVASLFSGLLPLCFTVAFAAPGESHYAKQGTNKVHYVSFGSTRNPTLVLIHGWGGSTEIWREQIPALTNRAHLLVIDLPGHGASDKPKLDYSVDYFAAGVLAMLQDAHVDKATLVGHSMGTPVICRVYQQAPEKVAAIVAVDGLLKRPKGDPAQMEQFTAPLHTPEYRQHVTNFISFMFPNPGTERLRDATLAQMLATPQYVLSSAMDGMFKQDQPDWDLKKVSIPVLVINAKNQMWTPEYEEYAKGLSPKIEYRTIDGPGHFLMLEKPKEFNDALLESLKKFELVK